MVEDRLVELIPPVDVALAQHVGPLPAGLVGTRPGPVMASADSLRVTVYGRGSHASMPHNAIDPVVLAAMIVLRLQTIVSREVDPSQTAVVTVGSIHAGTKGNVICDHAVLEINVRSYDDEVRATVLDAIRRIVVAECHASGCSRNPDIEIYGRLSVTVNDDETTSRVTGAFTEFFGNQFFLIPPVKASEDFGDIANALGAPYTYWFFGGANADQFAQALAAGRVSQDIPVNHAPNFAPIIGSQGRRNRAAALFPHPLICVGDPRKGGSPLSFLVLTLVVARAWWAVGPVEGQGGAPAAQRGRTTLTPAAGPPHADGRVDEGKSVAIQAM